MLVRLIYCSRPARQLGINDIGKIINVSEKNNKPDHISGILIFTDVFFIQCLEGPRNAVNQAYTRICQDDRHMDCILLRYEHVDSRLFGQWAMGRIELTSQHHPVVYKYSAHEFLDPYAMSSNQAELFMRDMGKISQKLAERKKMSETLMTRRKS